MKHKDPAMIWHLFGILVVITFCGQSSPLAAQEFEYTQSYCDRPFHTFLEAVDVAVIGTVRQNRTTTYPMPGYDYIMRDISVKPTHVLKGEPGAEVRFQHEYSSTSEAAATVGPFAEGSEVLIFVSEHPARPGSFPHCSLNTRDRYFGTPALISDLKKYLEDGTAGEIRYRATADNYGQVTYTSDKIFTGTVTDRRGRIFSQYETRDGKAHGLRRVYDVVPGLKKPRLTREEHYRNGQRHGSFKWYDADGRITGEETYEDGELRSSLKYDPAGEAVR